MPSLLISPDPQNHVWTILALKSQNLSPHAPHWHQLSRPAAENHWHVSLDVPRTELEACYGALGRIQFAASPRYAELIQEAESEIAGWLTKFYEIGTFKNYLAMIRRFWAAYSGVEPRMLTRQQAQFFLDRLAGEGASASQLNLAINAVQMFFDRFQGLSVRFPRPPAAPRESNLLTHEEIEGLLQEAASLRERVMILLVYGSGLRVKELCQLRPEHLNPDSGQVMIGGKQARMVPLSKMLRAEWPEFRRRYCGEHWVFEGRDPAQPMEARSLQYAFRRMCQLAGLQTSITLQTLRHSYGVWLVSRGRSNQEIMARMGLQSANAVRMYRKWHEEMDGGVRSPI